MSELHITESVIAHINLPNVLLMLFLERLLQSVNPSNVSGKG
mgnify:CR=1 FL=1|jgi:hypothetical protein